MGWHELQHATRCGPRRLGHGSMRTKVLSRIPALLLVAGLSCFSSWSPAVELSPPAPIPWKTGGEIVLFPDRPAARFYVLPLGTLPELEALQPQVPDEENAALWYFEALRRRTDDGSRFADFSMGKRRLDPGAPELNAWLKANEMSMACLDRAANIKSARWPLIDAPPTPNVVRTPLYLELQMPYLASLRAFLRLRSILARKALVEGKADEAIRQVKLAFAIPRHLDNQPFLWFGWVSIACDGITMSTIEEVVVSNRLSREQLETVAKILEQRQKEQDDGSRAELGEELGAKQFVDRFHTQNGFLDLDKYVTLRGDIVADTNVVPSRVLSCRAFRIIFPDQTMKAQIGRYFEALRARQKQPYYQGFGVGDLRSPFLGQISKWNVLAYFLLIPCDTTQPQFAARKASFDLARVGIALKRAELDTGRRPERLDELVPKYLTALPVDEMNGKPLGYSPREGGWRVWSVGRDCADDGGIRKDWGGPDLVFFVEEVPARMEHIRKDAP